MYTIMPQDSQIVLKLSPGCSFFLVRNPNYTLTVSCGLVVPLHVKIYLVQ